MAQPIDWTLYDQLKAQGLSERKIAEQMKDRTGVSRSTLRRAIEDRASVPTPVHMPVHEYDTDAEHSVDTGAVQVFDTGAVQRLDALEQDVQRLHRVMQSVIDRIEYPPVQAPVQITTLPPYPKGKAVRWNLWILDSIRDELATLAAKRDMSPSQYVQELLWKALREMP